MNLENKVLIEIYKFFIESSDFNGIPISLLSEVTRIPIIKLTEILKNLILSEHVSIQSNNNPHIISLGHYPIEKQIEFLNKAHEIKNNKIVKISHKISLQSNSNPICVYPSEKYLQEHRDISEIIDLPYTCQLALGRPQLQPLFFEIEVLDRYFKDPRYFFFFQDYSGRISLKDGDSSLNDADQIFLQSFGLGVDENQNRVTVVYLRYLKELTKEQQVFWKSKEILKGCKMRSEYYINTIEGDYTNSYSVFTAFLGEQKAISDLSLEIFKTSLFNKTFENENRPQEFTFFFIPTLKNYYDFIALLDKMLSDNINKAFFKDTSVPLFDDVPIDNGIVERKPKGTLRLLQEWLTINFNTPDIDLMNKIFAPLKQIRKERQEPAHKINENIYDKNLIEKQKKILEETYLSLKIIRHIFQKHPNGKHVEIKSWLDDGDIKIF